MNFFAFCALSLCESPASHHHQREQSSSSFQPSEISLKRIFSWPRRESAAQLKVFRNPRRNRDLARRKEREEEKTNDRAQQIFEQSRSLVFVCVWTERCFTFRPCHYRVRDAPGVHGRRTAASSSSSLSCVFLCIVSRRSDDDASTQRTVICVSDSISPRARACEVSRNFSHRSWLRCCLPFLFSSLVLMPSLISRSSRFLFLSVSARRPDERRRRHRREVTALRGFP